MMYAGCVFLIGIHQSRTRISGPSESVRWNACVHRVDLGLYSHPKEFLESETMLTPREKSPHKIVISRSVLDTEVKEGIIVSTVKHLTGAGIARW